MKLEKFEDIKAWQEARELTKIIYQISKKESFERDYALRDQIKRAAISIMANIAEGFERHSDKEFTRFLDFSSSSNSELQSHLYIALDQNYINQEEFTLAYQKSKLIGKLINGFIAYLKKKLQHCDTAALQHLKKEV
ncbi:MAG: four helix bundle protein [Candidatus Aminicenantia bacterium]